MQEYERVTSGVRDFLTRGQYCAVITQTAERCFTRLKAYLDEEGWDYTPDRADRWFQLHEDEISATDRDRHRMTLLRLRDIYECGEIRQEHAKPDPYAALDGPLKDSLDLFLNGQQTSLSYNSIGRYKRSCSLFLLFMQRAGCSGIDEITFDLMIDFYESERSLGARAKGTINGCVSAMMRFFFEHEDLPYGFSVIYHYLPLGKDAFWSQISAAAHEKIAAAMASSETKAPRELVPLKEKLRSRHVSSGYSRPVICGNDQIIDLLIIFLEMNGYRYSMEISMIWFDEIRRIFSSKEYNAHRTLCMLSELCSTSESEPKKLYRMKPNAFSLLPEWCAGPAAEYVAMKENEGWARSTMDMIRSSISRFCSYLDRIGVRSFYELDVTHIKSFNTDDIHRTPYGKNAYNTRIRRFLIYLGEKGLLQNPMLFTALTCTNAPKETIVVVLTDEEMSELRDCLAEEGDGISLRKKAMLLLGLKMGMRSSDIVNLKIDNIDWSTSSIHFIQKKTSVEVNLPMPTEVGNALFRYITEERRQKDAPDIFLSEGAPYRAVDRSSCERALQDALPERDVKGSGFHVTRKTYATDLLRNGVGADMVAEALGQRDISSVDRYLSLDQERMRMCPISLSALKIGRWEDGR